MGKIDFVECSFICYCVCRKTKVFNAVESIVLRTCDYTVILHGFCERSTHSSEQIRVFTVGFLRSAPHGIAKKINANTCKKVCIECRSFLGKNFTYTVFKLIVKACTAKHRNGETGALAHNNTSGTVCKHHGRNAESFASSCRISFAVIESALCDKVFCRYTQSMPLKQTYLLFYGHFL